MVHFENASIADGAVMSSGRLWLDTLLANADSLWDKVSFGRVACGNSYAHVIVEADIQ